MQPKRAVAYVPSMLVSLLIVFFAVGHVSAMQAAGEKAAKPAPHSKEMAAELPSGIASEIGDRLYNRIFDVNMEITATRTLMKIIGSKASHGPLNDKDKERLELHQEYISELESAKSSLAEFHTQIEACLEDCAQADKVALGNATSSVDGKKRDGHMEERIRVATEARDRLEESIVRLVALKAKRDEKTIADVNRLRTEAKERAHMYAELEPGTDPHTMALVLLRNDRQLYLIEYLSNESRYLDNTLRVCRRALRGF